MDNIYKGISHLIMVTEAIKPASYGQQYNRQHNTRTSSQQLRSTPSNTQATPTVSLPL
jgi:hypothetical protein